MFQQMKGPHRGPDKDKSVKPIIFATLVVMLWISFMIWFRIKFP